MEYLKFVKNITAYFLIGIENKSQKIKKLIILLYIFHSHTLSSKCCQITTFFYSPYFCRTFVLFFYKVLCVFRKLLKNKTTCQTKAMCGNFRILPGILLFFRLNRQRFVVFLFSQNTC